MNEQEKFLKDIEVDVSADPFAQPEVPKEEPKVDEPEEAPEDIKNRRHRRLEQKLEAERKANIELAERLAKIAEAKRETESPEYLKSIERIYGTDSPEAIAATELLKNALAAVKKDAEESALKRFQEERAREQEELAKEEQELDSMVEYLEDTYEVDLSSKSGVSLRKGFFATLERMSPKDSNGNVIAYADPDAVWEIYSQSIKKPENPAKSLAARGMVNSGATESKLTQDTTERWLKENGLI